MKCTATDACHDVGVCNPSTGQCSNPAKPDGTDCPGGSCEMGFVHQLVLRVVHLLRAVALEARAAEALEARAAEALEARVAAA
ncbi:MAG: hypothetical protein IPM54_21185 [Polyangiaceae bacterium]|nr:hypothetical protein [Polyangiaceae bacterium]